MKKDKDITTKPPRAPRGDAAMLAERIASAYSEYNEQVDLDRQAPFEMLAQQQYVELTIAFAKRIAGEPEIKSALAALDAAKGEAGK